MAKRDKMLESSNSELNERNKVLYNEVDMLKQELSRYR